MLVNYVGFCGRVLPQLSQKGLRGRKGTCWVGHPCAVAFIYSPSLSCSLAHMGILLHKTRTEMIQNSPHINGLRIMFGF